MNQIQELLFPDNYINTAQELYFHTDRNAWWDADNRCISMADGEVSFLSYFNAFSALKWRKFTYVRDVALALELTGSVEITLLRALPSRKREANADKNGGAGEVRGMDQAVLETCRVDTHGQRKTVSLSFGAQDGTGLYGFRVRSFGKGTLYGGNYCATDEFPRKNIRLAAVFCTCRRERYIRENLKRLRDYLARERNEGRELPLRIFVSDNGNSLDYGALSDDAIRVYPNRNTGGSGGYTRGMLEIMDAGEKFTHVVLMDDDIVIDPRIMKRLAFFLSCVKQEYQAYPVGGAMLRLDEPWVQFESGGNVLPNGQLYATGLNRDLRDLKEVYDNERLFCPDYNAWWFCCIPMRHIRENNLPFPFFVKYDDVEYGLRIGLAPILLNGICVWHESFERKYSTGMLYFDHRNRLIMNAVRHRAYTKKQLLRDLKLWTNIETALYRYRNTLVILRAVEDFLRGPQHLLAQEPEQIYRDAATNGYKLTDAYELEVEYDEEWYRTCLTIRDVDLPHKLVRKLTRNGRWRSANHDVIVPIIGAYPAQVYRARRALHYDERTGLGFVTEHDGKLLRECEREYRRIVRRIRREYDTAVAAWQDVYSELITKEFWENYLQIR